MDSVYPSREIISKKKMKLFDEWNQSEHEDEWECERAKRIVRVEENSNEIVMKECYHRIRKNSFLKKTS